MCAYVDPPSVHVGEYLPIRWDLEQNASFTSASSCSAQPDDMVLQNSLQCSFALYNGTSSTQPVHRFTAPCYTNAWLGNNLFTDPYFNDPFIAQSIGKSFIRITPDMVGDTLGEYQLVLDRIDYQYCDNGHAVSTSYA